MPRFDAEGRMAVPGDFHRRSLCLDLSSVQRIGRGRSQVKGKPVVIVTIEELPRTARWRRHARRPRPRRQDDRRRRFGPQPGLRAPAAGHHAQEILARCRRAARALSARKMSRAVVIGLPINMDGSEGPRAQASRAFVRNMARLTELPFVFWDERLSTVAAERALIEMDVSRKKRADAHRFGRRRLHPARRARPASELLRLVGADARPGVGARTVRRSARSARAPRRQISRRRRNAQIAQDQRCRRRRLARPCRDRSPDRCRAYRRTARKTRSCSLARTG